MHENVLTGIVGDKAKPFFVVEPLDFATGHNELLTFRGPLQKQKDTTEFSRAKITFKKRSCLN